MRALFNFGEFAMDRGIHVDSTAGSVELPGTALRRETDSAALAEMVDVGGVGGSMTKAFCRLPLSALRTDTGR